MFRLFQKSKFIISKSRIFFSTSNKLEDLAIISSQVIKQILKSPFKVQIEKHRNLKHETSFAEKQKQLLSKLQSYSLRQNILKQIQDIQDVSSQAKSEIRKIFVQGTSIDAVPLKTPPRVRKGMEQPNEQGQKLKTFCPSYLTTGQLFNSIMDKNQILKSKYKLYTKTYLLKGYYGISKTWAVLLFQKLSRYIINYRCSLSPSASIDPRIIKVPKIIYVPAQSKILKEDEFQEYIWSQCNEIRNKQNNNQKFKGVNNGNLQQLKQYFDQKGIPLLVIGDNFNKIVNSYQRLFLLNKLESQIKYQNLNSKSSYIQKKLKSSFANLGLGTTPKDVRNQYDLYSNINSFFQYLKTRYLVDGLLFISSVDIQEQILGVMKYQSESGHEQFDQKLYVNYPENLKYKSVKYQLADYFLFELNLRYLKKTAHINFDSKIDPESLKIKQQIKQQIQNLMTKDIYFFTNPLLIRQSLTLKNFTKQQIEEQIKKIGIKQYIINKFIETTKLSLQLFKKKISSFNNIFPNDNQRRDQLVCKIFMAALKNLQIIQEFNIRKQRILSQQNQLKIKQIEKQQKEINNYKYQVTVDTNIYAWLRIKQKVDKHLFYYDKNLRKFNLLLNPQLTIYLLKPLVVEMIKSQEFDQFIIQKIKQWDNGTKEKLLQFMLLNIFKDGKSKINVNRVGSTRQLFNLSDKVLGFQSIPTQKQKEELINYNFLTPFIKYAQLISNLQTKNQREKSYLLLPTSSVSQEDIHQFWKNGFPDNKIDMKSKCIDCSILKFDEILRVIEINLYDVSISKNQDKDMVRFYDFIRSYIDFKDKNKTSIMIKGIQYQIQVNYYTLALDIVEVHWSKNTHLKTLQQKSKGQLIFQSVSQQSFILNVNTNEQNFNQKKTVLKQIGFINLLDQFEIQSSNLFLQNNMEIIHKLSSNELKQNIHAFIRSKNKKQKITKQINRKASRQSSKTKSK